MSQQDPITHRNRWRTEGLREESGAEESLLLAGKHVHSNSTATAHQPITLSGEMLTKYIEKHTLTIYTYETVQVQYPASMISIPLTL